MAEKNIFAGARKLTNVKGYLAYTNNKEKKEQILGVYDTATDTNTYQARNWYWSNLAKFNQQKFKESGNSGRTYKNKKGEEKECQCVEAREIQAEIPNEFKDRDTKQLAKDIALWFKKQFGVECNVAIHWNDSKTNLHAHIIYSERTRLDPENDEPLYASRNMFIKENGVRARTKKEIMDENGNIKEGCYIIKKGSMLYTMNFNNKITYLKSNTFTYDLKTMLAKKWNDELGREKYQVFDHNDIYLAQKKIKKGYTAEIKERLEEENKAIRKYNSTVGKIIKEDAEERKFLLKIKNEILENANDDILVNTSKDYHRQFMMNLNAAYNVLVERLLELQRRLTKLINKSKQKAEEKENTRVQRTQKRNEYER